MTRRAAAAALASLAALSLAPAAAWAAPIPPPPSDAACHAARAHRTLPPIEAYDPRPGAPRVFAMQFKQEVRNVVSYASFRTKIECMIREDVVPRLAVGRPNVVAFNEDVGLLTLATGSRGRLARELFGRTGSLSCEPQGIPCAAFGALAAVLAAYGVPEAAYRARFGLGTPVSDVFVAATDTLVRGFMQTLSDMARRYGIYILGSNDQAPFRESTDPTDISLFRDPDLPKPSSVYVATSDQVYNEVFMWGPRDVRADGPPPLRNVVAQNKKVPLTPIENLLQLTPGPSTGAAAIANLRPYALPGTAARIGFATSLPAFTYGDPPPGTDPCSNTALYYMRCLDRLGTNLVIQDEANPGRWAANGGGGYWQPLEWMRSTWRAVSDPSVSFAYNVTPHMVGNLTDIAFDGQTAITQRGLGAGVRNAPRCTYVGNTFVPGIDPARVRADAGPKREFLALVPWVVPDRSRSALRDEARRLAPGSRDTHENDYIETAIAADLPFPPDRKRRGCLGAVAPASVHSGLGTAPKKPAAAPEQPAASPRGGTKGQSSGGEGGSLPFTGLRLGELFAAGLLMVAAGTAGRVGARRRRT